MSLNNCYLVFNRKGKIVKLTKSLSVAMYAKWNNKFTTVKGYKIT